MYTKEGVGLQHYYHNSQHTGLRVCDGSDDLGMLEVEITDMKLTITGSSNTRATKQKQHTQLIVSSFNVHSCPSPHGMTRRL